MVISMSAIGEQTAAGWGRRPFLKACAKLLAACPVWAAGAWAARRSSVGGGKWIAFYGQTADEEVLASYDVVILDPMFQGSISAIAESGATLCGYVSLGEIRMTDPYYAEVDPAALLQQNADWPGTRRVDVRHESWTTLVTDRIIPSIAARGFTGLLLDTLDTPPYLEQVDPNSNSGMREAAVALVRAIRVAFPDMLLIVNRGYAILSSIVDCVDAVVAESLLTSAEGREGGTSHRWNAASEVELQLTLLGPAVRHSAPVPILSLDYWCPSDAVTVKEIYARERLLGHHPYVATRALDTIIPEPGA
jgi:uncharacterized protein (TIGR01370 family)